MNLMINKLVQQLIINGRKRKFSSEIMNDLVARPSMVNQTFYENIGLVQKKGTQYFYQLRKNTATELVIRDSSF